MYNHPTEEQLRQYSERTLPPDAFAMIDKHVASCAVCHEKCGVSQGSQRDYEDLLSALLPASDDSPYHLSYEQLATYVDLELDEVDRLAVASHLEVCAQCGDDVRSLQEFKAGGLAGPAPELRQGPISASRASRHWLFRPAQRHLKRVAAVAAAIGLILLLALILLRPKPSGPTDLAGRPDNSNAALPQGPPRPDAGSDGRANQNNPPDTPLPRPEGPTDTGEASAPVLALNDEGAKITLDRQGKVAGLGDLPEPLRQVVQAALTTQSLQRPRILAELNSRPSTLLSRPSNPPSFRLLSPVGEVTQSGRPTFRWLPLEGASSYKVTVTDEGLNEVAASRQLTTLEWTLPESLRLKPDAIYSWQVTALKDGQEVTSPVLPAPQAKFKVLGRPEAQEMARALRTASRSHLVRGVMYAQAGLLTQAEQELRALVKANPDSRVAANLLRSARRMKRDGARRSSRP